MPHIDVPITPLLPKLLQTLTEQATLILQAPPGAGKTTRVPLALLEADWLRGKSILMLEPRRLAAINAARFMAKQLAEEVGRSIGYRIRHQQKVSPATRVEVITEGILTRRLQQDPELNGVGLVIFDEFHERHLQSDLALALCLDVQQGLREDLKLLIMSATLDTEPLARQLRAPILSSTGRSYPVTTHYSTHRPNERKTGSLVETTVAAVHRALQETTGDLLVFLPGEAEIRHCHQRLSGLSAVVSVCPLYGNLPFAEQERAIKPARQRKIVLATNIAETSLTIEGIGVVVDSGYCRQPRPRYDPGSGLTRLQLSRISQASAAQRAGRAGRLGPGSCYRLWSEGTQQALLPFTPAEIRTADLAPLVLDLLAWGISDPATLFWLDPPSPSAWQAGLELLDRLGALDSRKRLNSYGQALAGLPIHPRLGSLLLAAKNNTCLELGCDLAALLSEPDPWSRTEASEQSDSDILDRLELFYRQPNSTKLAAITRTARYWRRYFNCPASVNHPAATLEQLALLLAAAFPDRVARARQPGSKRYLLASGQGARLGSGSALQQPEFLIAVGLRIRQEVDAEICLASSVDKTTLEKLFPQLAWQQSCVWDQAQGRVVACEQQRLGALTINQRPGKLQPEQATGVILEVIRREGLQLLNWTDRVQQFRARLRLLHNRLPEQNWPDFSEQSLLQTLEDWLLPHLGTVRSREGLRKIDLSAALGSRLDWQQRQQLEQLAPERIAVPSGSQIRLQYPPAGPPILAVKLQEMFGQLDTPRIAAGRIPVVVHLLSPAGRP
ncbi:MAG: ATP-dependent helicase HrpB, partial [Deltaproteobacteria bacterium]|nr:ATP-dependent helicase HrpB [Deltaproteobacteria bacterium]